MGWPAVRGVLPTQAGAQAEEKPDKPDKPEKPEKPGGGPDAHSPTPRRRLTRR